MSWRYHAYLIHVMVVVLGNLIGAMRESDVVEAWSRDGATSANTVSQICSEVHDCIMVT